MRSPQEVIQKQYNQEVYTNQIQIEQHQQQQQLEQQQQQQHQTQQQQLPPTNPETSHNESEEHEPELRDLLVRALERNGVLSDLRAQLRASVYTIIEQERQKLSPVNNGLTTVQQSIVD